MHFRACSSFSCVVVIPKDDRLNDRLTMLQEHSQRYDRLESKIGAIDCSLNEMRIAFDHSMQFFESRLCSIDLKLDLPEPPKQLEGDGKVDVLKTLFENTSKKK